MFVATLDVVVGCQVGDYKRALVSAATNVLYGLPGISRILYTYYHINLYNRPVCALCICAFSCGARIKHVSIFFCSPSFCFLVVHCLAHEPETKWNRGSENADKRIKLPGCVALLLFRVFVCFSLYFIVQKWNSHGVCNAWNLHVRVFSIPFAKPHSQHKQIIMNVDNNNWFLCCDYTQNNFHWNKLSVERFANANVFW